MLQRVKAEIGEFGGFGVAEDAADAAVIVEVIVVDVNHGFIRSRSSPSTALSSAPAQISRRRGERSLRITVAPLYSMRNSPRVTVPITRAPNFHCAATSCTRASEAFGENGDDGARAAFAEEGDSAGCLALVGCERDLRCESIAREAGFGERDGEAAVADVVRGVSMAFRWRAPPGIRSGAFRRRDRWPEARPRRFRESCARIRRRKIRVIAVAWQLAGSPCLRGALRPSSSRITSPSSRKAMRRARSGVFDQAEHAEDRRGIDRTCRAYRCRN